MKLKLLYLLTITLISWNVFQNDIFIFERGNQKVILKIENGMNFLKWNEISKLTIRTENIPYNKIRVVAPGLRLLKGSNKINSESVWEIIPKKEQVKNDTLKLKFGTYSLKDKFWWHEFKILVK